MPSRFIKIHYYWLSLKCNVKCQCQGHPNRHFVVVTSPFWHVKFYWTNDVNWWDFNVRRCRLNLFWRWWRTKIEIYPSRLRYIGYLWTSDYVVVLCRIHAHHSCSNKRGILRKSGLESRWLFETESTAETNDSCNRLLPNDHPKISYANGL